MKWPSKIGVAAIRGYQTAISPILSRWVRCRFYPTCSEYMLLSIQKSGLIKGGWQGLKRWRRCNPHNLESCMDLP